MAFSKIILNGTTLMDLTQDTIAANKVATGITAHGADGEAIIGTKGSDYNWIGADPEIVWESEGLDYSFSDTTLQSWTPSTSASIIKDTFVCTPNQLYLDNTKFYNVIYETITNYVYNETPSVAYMDQSYCIGQQYFGARPYNYNSFINNINDWVTYTTSSYLQWSIYYTSSGQINVTQNNYGIYFTNTAPIFASQTSNPFGCNLKTPVVRVVANNNYMNSSAFSLLDLDKSNFHIKIKLYSLSNSVMRGIFDRFKELYDLNNTTT